MKSILCIIFGLLSTTFICGQQSDSPKDMEKAIESEVKRPISKIINSPTRFSDPSLQADLSEHLEIEKKESPKLEKDFFLRKVYVSEKGKPWFVDPQKHFWHAFLTKLRFGEGAGVSLNRPFFPLSDDVEIVVVKNGETIDSTTFYQLPSWRDDVICYNIGDQCPQQKNEVPLFNLSTSFLCLEDGKIPNLYDLQANFPEAKIGPYHEFMAKAPQMIRSLEKVGELSKSKKMMKINDSNVELVDCGTEWQTLIDRLRAVYLNYLSTNALWWYFGEERMNASAKAILGEQFDPTTLEKMNWAPLFPNPDWLTGFGTTRLIHSENGEVFVIDVGSNQAAEQIIKEHEEGKLGNVSGIFVTHYHYDHNTGIPRLLVKHPAPIYSVEPLADILERPGAYRMACLANVPFSVQRLKDGQTMKWNEFQFTFFDFPGQTLYHNALLVQKGDERPIFFIGDSFAPSGLDDYSTWNRNLLKNGKGYFKCLDIIRKMNPTPLLVNQHVEKPFEMDAARIDYMEQKLRERVELLKELLAVPEINFGLDHAWCRFDPFVTELDVQSDNVDVRASTEEIKLVITNHFDEETTFNVQFYWDEVFEKRLRSDLHEKLQKITIAPNEEGSITLHLVKNRLDENEAKQGILSATVSAGYYSKDSSMKSKDFVSGMCEAFIIAKPADK
ncbi:MAG: MBL fold metallo-hydrolase [Thermoguttaceae bacterium]